MIIPDNPLLNWYGGKWNLAPWIHGLLPEHDVFIDLFGGSGAMTVTSQAKKRVYNDLDSRLHRVFLALMEPGVSEEAERLLQDIPRSEEMTQHLMYLWHKEPEKLSSAQALWAAVYLGATTFSSWGPVRSTATFSSASTKSRWPRDSAVRQWKQTWQNVTIFHRDALEIIRQVAASPGSIACGVGGQEPLNFCLYADPPYDYEGSRGATGVYRHEIHELEEKLVPVLVEATKQSYVTAAVSGYVDSPTILAFKEAGWEVHIKSVPNRGPQMKQRAMDSKIEAVAVSQPAKYSAILNLFGAQ